MSTVAEETALFRANYLLSKRVLLVTWTGFGTTLLVTWSYNKRNVRGRNLRHFILHKVGPLEDSAGKIVENKAPEHIPPTTAGNSRTNWHTTCKSVQRQILVIKKGSVSFLDGKHQISKKLV